MEKDDEHDMDAPDTVTPQNDDHAPASTSAPQATPKDSPAAKKQTFTFTDDGTCGGIPKPNIDVAHVFGGAGAVASLAADGIEGALGGAWNKLTLQVI